MITRTEVKQALNIKTANATYDVFIDRMVLSINKEIKGWCGQSITLDTNVIEFIGDDSQYLLLKKFPISSITSIEYREKPTDNWSLIDSSTYAIVHNDGLTYLYYEGYYTAPFYRVEYEYGYEFITSGVDNQTIVTNDVPEEIRNVALEMALWMWTESNLSDDKSLTIMSKSISEAGKTVNYSYMKDWKPNWRRVLGKYRTYLV